MFVPLFVLCVGVVIMWLKHLLWLGGADFKTSDPLYHLGFSVWLLGNFLVWMSLLGFYS
jgi:hypothetical protein